MKTIALLRNKFLFTITMLMVALWLPSLSLAADYPPPGDFAQGAKSWGNNCSRCHNMRDPQDLRDDQWITTVFHMRLRAGLTGQQTRDILTFLQESNNTVIAEPVASTTLAANTADSLSGADVYNGTCIACHGGNGKGTVPGAPDLDSPEGPLLQSDEVLLQHVIEGFKSTGSPMAMPPKGGNSNLTEADIRAVLAYMRERFGK